MAERMLAGVRANAGVESAAVVGVLPFAGIASSYWVNPPNQPAGRRFRMNVVHVSDGFFATMQLPILRGRGLDSRDWIGARKDEVNVVLSAGGSEPSVRRARSGRSHR